MSVSASFVLPKAGQRGIRRGNSLNRDWEPPGLITPISESQITKENVMGQPAASMGDMHLCPMVTGIVPHVGRPILPPGAITNLIGGMPAAGVTDRAVCVGPPDLIALGSFTVRIGGCSRHDWEI